MAMPPRPAPLVSLVAVRDRAIARLSEHFAEDRVDVDEFERRVDLIHRAQAPAEIEAVLADLPALASEPEPETALAPIEPTEDRQSVVSVMGGVRRRGSWLTSRRIRVVTVMGGAELDFREVAMPAGVTELNIVSFMGGVEIIVPPDLAVQMDGVGIMGGFEQMNRAAPRPDALAPLLKISGFAMMGGVNVTTRLPGEGRRAAARREKAERKAARRALPAHED